MLTLTSNINAMFNTSKSPTWIIKITLDDATRYYASQIVTISSQEYVGRFIVENGVDDIEQGIDISIGGNMAAVGNLSIRLKEIETQNGLHRSFKPHTAGTELTNRAVEVGMIFNLGSLATTDIVWLYKGAISDFDIVIDGINLDIIGVREIDGIDLPKTLISESNYPNAPKENLGEPLPLLYGNFNQYPVIGLVDEILFKPIVCPSICVDKINMEFVVANHVCHTAGLKSFYHTGSMKSFAVLQSETAVATYSDPVQDEDNSGIATITIQKGTVVCFAQGILSTEGRINTATDFANAVDEDVNTYASISKAGNNYLSLQIDGLPNGDTFGNMSFTLYAIGSHNFRLGYLLDGELIASFHSISTQTNAATQYYFGQTMSIAASNVSELQSRQIVVDCDGVGENVDVGIMGFYDLGIILAEKYLPKSNNTRQRPRIR